MIIISLRTSISSLAREMRWRIFSTSGAILSDVVPQEASWSQVISWFHLALIFSSPTQQWKAIALGEAPNLVALTSSCSFTLSSTLKKRMLLRSILPQSSHLSIIWRQVVALKNGFSPHFSVPLFEARSTFLGKNILTDSACPSSMVAYSTAWLPSEIVVAHVHPARLIAGQTSCHWCVF